MTRKPYVCSAAAAGDTLDDAALAAFFHHDALERRMVAAVVHEPADGIPAAIRAGVTTALFYGGDWRIMFAACQWAVRRCGVADRCRVLSFVMGCLDRGGEGYGWDNRKFAELATEFRREWIESRWGRHGDMYALAQFVGGVDLGDLADVQRWWIHHTAAQLLACHMRMQQAERALREYRRALKAAVVPVAAATSARRRVTKAA